MVPGETQLYVRLAAEQSVRGGPLHSDGVGGNAQSRLRFHQVPVQAGQTEQQQQAIRRTVNQTPQIFLQLRLQLLPDASFFFFFLFLIFGA